jgi:hypothetical protein
MTSGGTSVSVWLLMLDVAYDPPVIFGAFPDEQSARAIEAALDGTTNDLYVEEVEVLDPTVLRVEDVEVVLHARVQVKWDGTGLRDQVGEVERRVRVLGVPGYEDSDARTPPLDVEVAAFESGYKLGVYVDIMGSDLAAVRSVHAEWRDRLRDMPLAETVAAWAQRSYVPPWVWARPENQGILAALEAEGFTRLQDGPLGS